ncbi:MAG: hypothetical protein BWY63_03321 [Chloroflexi bacterium ADurb.Bin360]|nr:MAG: hypothetical protein BWY63_03321 [Chloroflexi bacterium ADurb.Bin360]
MPNQLKTFHDQVRHLPALQSLIVLEDVLSYPIPYRSGERLALRFLFFSRSKEKDAAGTVALYRPHARVSVSYPEGRLLEFADLGFETGVAIPRCGELIGRYPHPAMAILSYAEAQAQKTAYFYALQQLLPLYAEPAPPSPEVLSLVKPFVESFERVSEPAFRSYYEALSPQFFSWIKRAQVL